MTVFSDMVDGVFADDDFVVSGTYTPSGGSPVTVSVLLSRPEVDAVIFETGAVIGDYSAQISVSQLAAAAEGDALVIGSDSYTVAGDPMREDPDQLIWTMQLVET